MLILLQTKTDRSVFIDSNDLQGFSTLFGRQTASPRWQKNIDNFGTHLDPRRCSLAQYGLTNTHLTEAFPWRTGGAVPSIKPERVEQDSLNCCAEELAGAVAESRAIWVMLSSGSLALLQQR